MRTANGRSIWKGRGAMISLTRVAVLAATQRKQFSRSTNDKPAIATPPSHSLSLFLSLPLSPSRSSYSPERTLEGQPFPRLADRFIRDTREIRRCSAERSHVARCRIDASCDWSITQAESPRILDIIFWHTQGVIGYIIRLSNEIDQ